MEIKIISDKKNDVMSRREIECYVLSDGPTPKIKDVSVELCKKLNLNPEFTIIVKLSQPFGIRRVVAYVHCYNSKEELERTERKYILERYKKRLAEKQEQTG